MPQEMHYLLAERYKVAYERIAKAVGVLAKDFDLPPESVAGLEAPHHDPARRSVLRAEASADVLERIVAGLKEKKAEEKAAEKPAEKLITKPAAKSSKSEEK